MRLDGFKFCTEMSRSRVYNSIAVKQVSGRAVEDESAALEKGDRIRMGIGGSSSIFGICEKL